MKMITIAIKRPAEAWKIKEVEDTLETYQDIVGGYIEHFLNIGEDKGVALFCNEEGKLLQLEPNIHVPELHDEIVGTIFAVRVDEEGEFTSLTESDKELFKGI